MPSVRTVRRRVTKLRKEQAAKDPSGLWTLAEGDPVDAQMVLGILDMIMGSNADDVESFNRARDALKPGVEQQESTKHEGRLHLWHPFLMRRITRAEAEWVVRLTKAAPTLWPKHAYVLYVLAVHYGQLNGKPTQHLDSFVAARPWLSAENATRFLRLLSLGLNKDIGEPDPWVRDFAQELLTTMCGWPHMQAVVAALDAGRELPGYDVPPEDGDARQPDDRGGDDGTG